MESAGGGPVHHAALTQGLQHTHHCSLQPGLQNQACSLLSKRCVEQKLTLSLNSTSSPISKVVYDAQDTSCQCPKAVNTARRATAAQATWSRWRKTSCTRCWPKSHIDAQSANSPEGKCRRRPCTSCSLCLKAPTGTNTARKDHTSSINMEKMEKTFEDIMTHNTQP